MATTILDDYYYDEQFRSYIVQFAAVFAGIKVMIGKNEDNEPKLITVPIKNASMDRVVGWVKGEQTQNKPIRLPIMSFQFSGIDQAPDRRKAIGMIKRSSYMPSGHVFPDDIKVIEQRQPVPYKAQFELAIWASNQDQHYQMVEQILTLFDPTLQLQNSDELFDTTRMTNMELVDIRFDETVPSGSDRRVIQTRMGFIVDLYLSTAVNVHSNFIKDIYVRIGAIGASSTNSYDIISDLDTQGAEYDKVFTTDDIDID